MGSGSDYNCQLSLDESIYKQKAGISSLHGSNNIPIKIDLNI